jgi:hypothetical protein
MTDEDGLRPSPRGQDNPLAAERHLINHFGEISPDFGDTEPFHQSLRSSDR